MLIITPNTIGIFVYCRQSDDCGRVFNSKLNFHSPKRSRKYFKFSNSSQHYLSSCNNKILHIVTYGIVLKSVHVDDTLRRICKQFSLIPAPNILIHNRVMVLLEEKRFTEELSIVRADEVNPNKAHIKIINKSR